MSKVIKVNSHEVGVVKLHTTYGGSKIDVPLIDVLNLDNTRGDYIVNKLSVSKEDGRHIYNFDINYNTYLEVEINDLVKDDYVFDINIKGELILNNIYKSRGRLSNRKGVKHSVPCIEKCYVIVSLDYTNETIGHVDDDYLAGLTCNCDDNISRLVTTIIKDITFTSHTVNNAR